MGVEGAAGTAEMVEARVAMRRAICFANVKQ